MLLCPLLLLLVLARLVLLMVLVVLVLVVLVVRVVLLPPLLLIPVRLVTQRSPRLPHDRTLEAATPQPLIFLRWRSFPEKKRVAAVLVALGLRASFRSRFLPRRTTRQLLMSHTRERSQQDPLTCQKFPSTAMPLRLLQVLLCPLLLWLLVLLWLLLLLLLLLHPLLLIPVLLVTQSSPRLPHGRTLESAMPQPLVFLR